MTALGKLLERCLARQLDGMLVPEAGKQARSHEREGTISLTLRLIV
ncbi:MAG: hypothetical protein JGK24_24600 [Microcoleus sp. PH2017_29_MFU_D_A]|nr:MULTISPECIES: hypothetical protein [unclassified Microcoleus]MCC3606318.1 hypothetical protein [Microcoleus sp. PH2017_29_MFU_D_A]MCC3637420.1 hypothetical protein [Microcoleus sp. PH2017_37_MFU_D_B]